MMRTLATEKHAAQRQAVLDAARICFCRTGFHRATTDAICAKAGMSTGKLFHYFANKRALILAVIEDQARQTFGQLEALLWQDDLVAALGDVLDEILRLSGNAQERQLILEVAAEAARDPDAATLVHAGDQLLREGLEALLAEAVSQRQILPVLTVDQIARILMIVIDGIFSRAAAHAGFDPATERAALYEVLRQLLNPVARNG